jgi:hypothetical protein
VDCVNIETDRKKRIKKERKKGRERRNDGRKERKLRKYLDVKRPTN